MAYVGMPYYGYCPYTVAEDGTGKEVETLGAGTITRSAIKWSSNPSAEMVELWAGDRMEQQEGESPTANVSIERSYLSVEEEAKLGGHTYTEADGMTHSEDDIAPFCRVAAMSKQRTPDRTIKYKVVTLMRVVFAPVADEFNTRQKSKTYGTSTMTGTATTNGDGAFAGKQEFDTYDAALAHLKKMLNIQEVPAGGNA